MTQIPKNMNQQLQKLGLAPLFATPPKSSVSHESDHPGFRGFPFVQIGKLS